MRERQRPRIAVMADTAGLSLAARSPGRRPRGSAAHAAGARYSARCSACMSARERMRAREMWNSTVCIAPVSQVRRHCCAAPVHGATVKTATKLPWRLPVAW
jgi:hypothetical protein